MYGSRLDSRFGLTTRQPVKKTRTGHDPVRFQNSRPVEDRIALHDTLAWGDSMRYLLERIEGIGELESWETPDERVLVCFSFDITTEIPEHPEISLAATKRHSTGVVCALSGKTPGNGYYRLIAHKETLKVQNLGLDQWVVSADA